MKERGREGGKEEDEVRRGKTGETVKGEQLRERSKEREREVDRRKKQVQRECARKRKRRMGGKVGCHPVCVNIPGEIRSPTTLLKPPQKGVHYSHFSPPLIIVIIMGDNYPFTA